MELIFRTGKTLKELSGDPDYREAWDDILAGSSIYSRRRKRLLVYFISFYSMANNYKMLMCACYKQSIEKYKLDFLKIVKITTVMFE